MLVVLVLYAGYLVRTIASEPHNWLGFVLVGGILAGSSIGIAWLAHIAWMKIAAAGPHWLVTIVLAYHALFGPVMLATRIVTEVSSNRQPAVILWPHVVHGINSFE